MVYPHSVPSAVTSSLEPQRRKRGRPRKYGTVEQALAAKKTASSSSAKERREQQQALHGAANDSVSGTAGHGFTTHVMEIAAGEDVHQKIMMFTRQSKREICILSASGSVLNASLRQPANSGNITYGGQFDIISLSGSYVRTPAGDQRTGGLGVCLSNSDGQIIGGGVGGPLLAAGPVQVIIGTFVMDTKKDAKIDAAGSGLPLHVAGYHPTFEAPGRNLVGGNNDQTFGGGSFVIRPPEWNRGLDGRGSSSFELSGRTENGDYNPMQD